MEKLKEKIVLIEQRKNYEILRSVIMEPWSEILEEELLKKGCRKNDTFQLIVLYVQKTDLMGEIEVICKNILHNTPFYSFENPLFNKQYFILLQTDEKYKEKFLILSERLLSSLQVQLNERKYYICLTDLWQKASDLNKAYKQAEKLVRHVKLGTEKTLSLIHI